MQVACLHKAFDMRHARCEKDGCVGSQRGAMPISWHLAKFWPWLLGAWVDLLFLGIFGAHDQEDLYGPMVSPTVFGVKESKYGLRFPRSHVDLQLDLCLGLLLGGGGPRHNPKNALKIGLGPPHHAQKPWGISSCSMESHKWCLGNCVLQSVLQCVLQCAGTRAHPLHNTIWVVPMHIFLVDNPPLDVVPMWAPTQVPWGQAHPILTHVATLNILPIRWRPIVHETQEPVQVNLL